MRTLEISFFDFPIKVAKGFGIKSIWAYYSQIKVKIIYSGHLNKFSWFKIS